MYVLDLFVKVPPSAVAPIRCDHMEVDATESKGNESLSIALTRLFDGRRSMRGRQVQAN